MTAASLEERQTRDSETAIDVEVQNKAKVFDVEVTPNEPCTLALDDPESSSQKLEYSPQAYNHLGALCVWVLTLTYDSTAYVASVPTLMQRYHISQEVAILGVTFTRGLCCLDLRPSCMADRLYIALADYFTVLLVSGQPSPPTPQAFIFRFFMGFFGSAPMNNVPASIGDYTTPIERGMYSIWYAIMAFGGPALGPLISAFIQQDAGFRNGHFSTVLSILAALVPETHGPTLLNWRIAKEGKVPPPLKFGQVMAVFKVAFARPMIYLFTGTKPIIMMVSAYLSILYGILYGVFEAFAVVYLEIRGFKNSSYGLTYISLALGFFGGCVLLATSGQQLYIKSVQADAAKGIPTRPEARLELIYFGAILSPISLFIFAWTAPFTNVHWIGPCIAEFLFACSIMLIFTGFIPYLIHCYPLTGASALAAVMCTRALVGSVFPLFTLQMYHSLTVQGATSLLAGLSCLLAPIPFIFKAHGTRMRVNSKHTIVNN
ncbi:major facilitator superfamily domain-containing protein [Mycena capillaripes]|nr:major facilitator superfamily domain-containing protein [Mycena capillaripes]